MQHTDKYQLDLIERTDPFSPDALNENTQKVEAALDAKADAAETGQQFAALAARIATLEGKTIAIGSYTGNGSAQIITLGFTPSAVFMQVADNNGGSFMLIQENKIYDTYASSPVLVAEVVGSGFRVINSMMVSLNASGKKYVFIAFS